MSRRFAGVWPSGSSIFARKIRPRRAFRLPSKSSKICPRCVHRDTDAPFPDVLARPGIALTRVDEGLDVRPVQIGSHHAHAFPIAPVELAALLFELELLRSERAAGRERRWPCFSRRDPNAGGNRRSPLGCPYWSSTYHRPRCRPRGRPESSAFLDDRLEVGTIGICGQTRPPPASRKKIRPATSFFRFGVFSDLVSVVSMFRSPSPMSYGECWLV